MDDRNGDLKLRDGGFAEFLERIAQQLHLAVTARNGQHAGGVRQQRLQIGVRLDVADLFADVPLVVLGDVDGEGIVFLGIQRAECLNTADDRYLVFGGLATE